MKDSPNLDLLRSIAVSLVVGSHVALAVTRGQDLAGYNLHTMGRLGVMIFFVHTTLVLMYSLERHGSAAVPFYVRRFFRIYPLSVFVVSLITILLLAVGKPPEAAKVISSLLLVQNLTGHLSMLDPLWSLPYEVQMYLVLPALFAITRTARALHWTALLWLVSLALAAWTSADLLRFFPCFLPGMLAYVLSKRVQARLGSPWLFALVGLIVATVPALVALGIPQSPLFWSLCLAVGLVIPFCRELVSQPVAAVAKIVATYSYGIYITHSFAIAPLQIIGTSSPVAWFAFLVLLPALAYIAYLGIEKPGIALGARLADRMQGGYPSVRISAARPVPMRPAASSD
jgi:peptidoglycan/LPS O-acetylase OafA/YrhL